MQDLQQKLQSRAQNAVMMPPRSVGPTRPNYIEGEFTVSHSESPMARGSVAPSVEIHIKNPPLGAGVLGAAWRAGLKDLQNVVLNPFPNHVAQHEELGSIANPTQLAVNNLNGDAPDHKQSRGMSM